MQEQEWCLFGIRPGNSPERRIMAVAELLMRYRACGIFDGMLELVRSAPQKGNRVHLERGITVDMTGLFAMKPALLGKARAGEIVINVILPLFYSYAKKERQSTLAVKIRRLYLDYPSLTPNYITRLMSKNLGLVAGQRLNACGQQGLIYIFKTHCRYRDCGNCPVVEREADR